MASALLLSVLYLSSSPVALLFSTHRKSSHLVSHPHISVSSSPSSSSFSATLTPQKPFSTSPKEKLGSFKGVKWGNLWSLNNWVVRDYYRLVDSVNGLEQSVQGLSDEQLRSETTEFRQRLGLGETLADIQAVAFAMVHEAARRTVGMRHFDVQTGEGKTLVSTLAASLNALSGNGVHVVAVNDYLAQRDAEWMGCVHRFLGLSRGMRADERRSNCGCDITYTNNSELGFDYLRDNLCGNKGQLVTRWPNPFHFAIVDEVDSVLIDEGRKDKKD
ncbi:putative protein translocase subunit SecA, SecA DEAD-like, SecA motor DEAD [Dioscorea sansibarensis]